MRSFNLKALAQPKFQALKHVGYIAAISALFLFLPNLLQADFSSPSEQVLKRDGAVHIKEKMLASGVPKALFPLFETIASTEEAGHVGYHASSQDYRIYQDIIRFTVEEILELPIREDFHFLRIPGDPDLQLDTIDAFFSYWGSQVNNKTPLRRKQLIALNYGIYSNYAVHHSCSALIFCTGHAHQSLDYPLLLEPFYEALGLEKKTLTPLFETARSLLQKEGGILLRIRDLTGYTLADAQCYPSRGRGFRWGKRRLSEEYASLLSEDYIKKRVEISPQISLVANTRYSLNPLSALSIQRWDFYSSEERSSYEGSLREMIRSLPRNSQRAMAYRQKLLEIWSGTR